MPNQANRNAVSLNDATDADLINAVAEIENIGWANYDPIHSAIVLNGLVEKYKISVNHHEDQGSGYWEGRIVNVGGLITSRTHTERVKAILFCLISHAAGDSVSTVHAGNRVVLRSVKK